jgi:alkanesulfonate monooxygenase SsuD/methylene tetrahydromethanopterin reductase-like flavin-dependent oxidoreductase (luciferase family)
VDAKSGDGVHDTGGSQQKMGNGTKVEFSAIGFCPPFAGADVGRLYEDLGYDIKQFGENHNQSADVFAEMRDAAAATDRIRLLAGPANFVTRDPGVVASGVAAVQVASAGRAICGIARGDSAVMLAGKRPQRHDDLVRDLGFLQTYLGGGTLAFGDERSSLEWLGDLPYAPVPVELVCSGPRTIALAAAVADRIGLSVGGNPERIRWAMEIVAASLAEHGRSPADITVCAYLPIAVTSDRQSGRMALVARTAGWAHMSSLPGNDLSAQPAILQRVTTKLRSGYDYRFHTESAPLENANTAMVDPEFADWFGVGGPPSYVTERLIELVELGVGCFGVAVPRNEHDAMATEVMPAVRKAVS